MLRRSLVLALALCAAAAVTSVQAATTAPFTQAAFEAAQAAGKPILIAVDASWCPVCAKQRPIVEGLMSKPEFKDLVLLKVDFDAQKDVLKTLGVTKQSTLIAWRGKAEKDRATGITAEDAIKALMLKTAA